MNSPRDVAKPEGRSYPTSAADSHATRVLVVMGVAGSGKTTVGRVVAERLAFDFVDADELHAPEAIRKMAAGQGLDDADRWPWLARVRKPIDARLERQGGPGLVVACSALRQSYRDVLGLERPGVLGLFLEVSSVLLERRLAERPDHFAGPALLESQLATLELPEPSRVLDANGDLGAVCGAVLRRITG